jgi:hypothetical protein
VRPARRGPGVAVLLLLLTLASGCGGGGLCVSTGGHPEECHEGWTQSECQDWNTTGVNGASWTFYGTGTCVGRGFRVKCPGGSYVYDASDCG